MTQFRTNKRTGRIYPLRNNVTKVNNMTKVKVPKKIGKFKLLSNEENYIQWDDGKREVLIEVNEGKYEVTTAVEAYSAPFEYGGNEILGTFSSMNEAIRKAASFMSNYS